VGVQTAGADGQVKALGWMSQAGLVVCSIIPSLGLFWPGLVLPQMQRAFAGTPHLELLTQMIGPIASFAFAIGAPVAGRMVGRFGCRALIVPSLIVLAIAGTAPALLDNLWAILAVRLVVGLTVAGSFACALAGVAALPVEQRARLFGLFVVTGSIAGIMIFPLIGVIARAGWRPPFAISLVVLAALPLTLRVPRSLGIAPRRAATDAGAVRAALIPPTMAVPLVVATFTGLVLILPSIYGPLYLSSWGIADTRLLAIPVTLSSTCGCLVGAAYARLNRRFGVGAIAAATPMLMGVALLLAGSTHSLAVYSVAIAMQGGLVSTTVPNVNAAAALAAPEGRSGEAIGLINSLLFGVPLVVPFIVVWIRGLVGLDGVFRTAGVCGLLIGLGVLLLGAARRRRPAPAPEAPAP
jgi:MFS family permease